MKAACGARSRYSGIVVIARTDSLAPLGFDEALERLKIARSLGADAGLCEGLENEEQARQLCGALSPWPIVLNQVANGKSPNWTVDEAANFG
jgi:2-methylisocitrate lyase-like PEP mutase family enzyme